MSTAIDSLTLRVQAEHIANRYLPNGGRPAMVSNPDTVQVFLAALADGNYRETACKLAGIAKQTLYNTIRRADEGDESAIAFVDALEKAEASAESQMVQAVRAAGKMPQYWAAAATHLERKFPERWGKRDEATVTAKVQVSIGGIGQAQVLVGVQVSGSQSLSPSVSPDMHRLSASTESDQGLIIGDYVNPPTAVPVTESPAVSPGSQIPAHAFEGDPTPDRSPLAGGDSTQVKARLGRRKEKRA